jgi:peptidoglycan hydrolase-like protein with peptidoglycan-binding domain
MMSGVLMGAMVLRRKQAVKKLQQQYGIGVDGVVGPQTWSVIDSLENEGPIVS